MKLTEEYLDYLIGITPKIKQQIIDDYEKARKWDDLPDEFCHTSLEDMVRYAEERQQLKKLRERIEGLIKHEGFKYWNGEGLREQLENILEESKFVRVNQN